VSPGGTRPLESIGADDRRVVLVERCGQVERHGGLDAWPADRYLNIWVCPLSGGLLGYAQFPGGLAVTDGVVILHSPSAPRAPQRLRSISAHRDA